MRSDELAAAARLPCEAALAVKTRVVRQGGVVSDILSTEIEDVRDFLPRWAGPSSTTTLACCRGNAVHAVWTRSRSRC